MVISPKLPGSTVFRSSEDTGVHCMEIHSDADWSGHRVTRKPFGLAMFAVDGAIIHHMCRSHRAVSMSSTESKWYAAINASCQGILVFVFTRTVLQKLQHFWFCLACDALTEFTEVRGDMASLLQPRMAPPRRPDTPAPHLRTGRGSKGKHKGDGKGKHSSCGLGNQSSTGGAKWVTKFEDKGKTRFLCRDFSSQKGCSFPDCNFEHLCPVPRPDGRPCLGKHPAFQHKAAGH